MMKALRVFVSVFIFFQAEAIPAELGLDTTIGTTAATEGTSGTSETPGTTGTEGTEGCISYWNAYRLSTYYYVVMLYLSSLSVFCRDDGDRWDRNHGDHGDWRDNVLTITNCQSDHNFN